jgi:hypothetical protein
MTTFKNWIHRLRKLPLNNTNNNELNTIISIAENNGYNKKQTTSLYNQNKKSRKGTRKRNKNGYFHKIHLPSDWPLSKFYPILFGFTCPAYCGFLDFTVLTTCKIPVPISTFSHPWTLRF